MASDGTNGNGVSKVVFAAFKPQLAVPAQKADDAVKFYKGAFGAEELKRASHPKRKADQESPLILCADLKIGGAVFSVCDVADDPTEAEKEAAGTGGIVFRLEAPDVKEAVAQAVEAGAALDGEIAEDDGPCNGGLVGKVKDPFGFVWVIASAGKGCGGEADVEA